MDLLQALAAARRLLVVDPCEQCERLLPRLQDSGWQVQSCGLELAGELACDVGLVRLRRSHLQQPERLKQLISQSGTEWIAVLSAETLALAEAPGFIGEWFFDYHTLPFDLERVSIALGRAFGMARLRGKVATGEIDRPHELLGSSRSITELRHLLARLAPVDAPVLILGESGSGRELAARILHRLSPRASGPLLAASCSALDEKELFGDEHYSGLIEQADGGTLLLGEVGELAHRAQARLLRTLQEARVERGGRVTPVNVRLLATSRVDLESELASGALREDFYYLLAALQARTTPLRERRDDIASLAGYFTRRYAAEVGRRPRSFSDGAIRALADHDWPGNVRELATRVRRATVLSEQRQVEAEDLGLASGAGSGGPFGSLEDYVHRAERQALHDVLLRYTGNMTQAARVLGISRPTFYRLLHKHQMR
ncbi:sigma-54-dependent transcriptional regulator [Pseudomonas sp. Gutcm_11s]|uniref:sigma-54-dependent transcriptional regulator n=1 Tax=Pseudomonas sp. Gutcm_11s TaxID=3026088 RepID=UPI00235EA548|nr:sigma-54 dependent transcriptional regulator [Pseudomonas sp. Gutcm_11s]MDD0843454.1 sigma-54 dependent transcriptional regulator [Pseudomonas sp. Gutcm_11s]